MLEVREHRKGKIYKIVSTRTNRQYFGGTTKDKLEDVLGHTKSLLKVMLGGECKIMLCELYPCNSRKELNERKKFYIDNNECMNKTTEAI